MTRQDRPVALSEVRLLKYPRPTAVNRVNYAGGGMLRLVNEQLRAWWSQLGHQGRRKRARVTVLGSHDRPADEQ